MDKPTPKPAYAAKTEVDADRTKQQIQKLLEKHGATSFAIGYDQTHETIMFELEDRRIRYSFPVLTLAAIPTTRQQGPGRVQLTENQREEMLQQKTRTRWRELLLLITAKLVAVQAGITTLEEEFLAHVVLPNSNQTFHEWASPYLKHAYIEGNMPPLLPNGDK